MNPKKKILFVHHGTFNGGAPRSLSFLIDKLDKTKYDIIVLGIVNSTGKEVFTGKGIHLLIAKRLYAFHGTTVSGMNLRRFVINWVGLLPTLFGAYRIIKRIKPDLVHLNSTCLFAFAVSAKIISKKIKVITHVREPLLDGISGKILKYMNYFFTDWDIPISKFDQKKLVKRNNSTIVHNFVDFDEFNKEQESNKFRLDLDLPRGAVLFTYIARITESNGTIELINMIKPIIKKYDNFHFAIVGFPDNSNSYIDLVKKISKGHLNIHLIKFRNKIPELLSSTDVFVCPFTLPHFSRGVIEASAMGIPCIGTDIGGVNELIIDKLTGFLYKNNNSTEFSQSVINLGVNELLRKKMGQNAYKFARKWFNSKKNVQVVNKIYISLLETNN